MDTVELFRRREEFARRLVEERGETPELCFAISGMVASSSQFSFSRKAVLREVERPPGEVELARALMHKYDLSSVARHTPSITHELAVFHNGDAYTQANMDLGWWITSALRVRSLADILVPLVADSSWDTVSVVREGSFTVQLIEDVPAARRLGGLVTVTDEDLGWVDSYLLNWISMLERPAFRLAVDSLTTHHQHANLRMSAAALWSGFEALFGISSEIRFRISLLAAAYLEERGEDRLFVYRRIKKLYDYRSKAVHGGATTEDKLAEHIVEVRSLLSRLLCKMTELGHLPSTEEFEERLLG